MIDDEDLGLVSFTFDFLFSHVFFSFTILYFARCGLFFVILRYYFHRVIRKGLWLTGGFGF